MNKNLIEIYKTCKTDPTPADHYTLIFLGLAIYYSITVSNLWMTVPFGIVFIFKLIGYITYLVLPTKRRDELETNRAKRIYEMLGNE